MSEQMVRRAIAAAAMVLAVAVPATACSGSSEATASTAATAEVVAAGATVIDVRTPAEFAQGHLVGAVNIPVEFPDFAGRIAQLDPSATYVVYCRTGRRSAAAVAQMKAAGFTDLLDLGGFEEAAAASGLAVTRP